MSFTHLSTGNGFNPHDRNFNYYNELNGYDGVTDYTALDLGNFLVGNFGNENPDDNETPDNRFDFNGDGTPDILWRNQTKGSNRIWFMNSDGTRDSIHNPGRFNSDYQLEAVEDFNGDGTPDILWAESDKRV